MQASSPSTMRLDAVAQIALTVSDLDRARRFYRDVLGLRHLFDAGSMAFFQCGDLRLMLGAAEENPPRGGSIVYFRTPDIQAAHAVLVDAEVAILQPPRLVAKMPDHDLWMAFFTDPDGNQLALLSERPAA